MVAWAASEGVPEAGVGQVLAGGVIVAPLVGGQVVKLRAGESGALEEASIDAGFIPLTGEPLRPWDDRTM